MCVADLVAPALTSEGLSRRGFLGAGIAGGLTASTVGGRKSLVLPGLAEGAVPPSANGGPGSTGVSLKWLGTNGWEITFGSRTILLDPWLSRTDAGFFSGRPNPETPLTLESALIDQHITRADQILIGHGHHDHIADIPYIARKTSAMVLGSESHINLLRAHRLPEDRLVPCRGGEVLQFDGYTIEVVPSLHSVGPTKKVPFAGRFSQVPIVPRLVKDLPEGDTLIYLLTVDQRVRIFLMSTANFTERALTGLRPDVALVAPFGRSQVHDFTPRLLKALEYPRFLLPTHWDNWERPITAEPEDGRGRLGNDGNLDVFVKELRQAAPKSQVVVMKYFGSFTP
jgi:L-ascorbate metabolism protein UlaG (beta-lactamase superfamily)